MKNMGKSAAISSLAMSSPLSIVSQLLPNSKIESKTMTIGIIGAENSHTAGFGKLFNMEKAFPGIEVKYVWGETEEFAKKAMKEGAIPKRVKNPSEMLGKIDALIVDHRHAKFHLKAATPFVKAGIPTFIDKPFCYRQEEGKKFLALARGLGTPVTSFSSIAHSYETFDIKEQVASMGEINQVVRYGPMKLDSEYGGVFFYGVHLVQPLLYIFGNTVQKVRIINTGKNNGANLVFQNGMLATLVSTTKKYGWETHVETHEGIIKLKSGKEETKPGKNYMDMGLDIITDP